MISLLNYARKKKKAVSPSQHSAAGDAGLQRALGCPRGLLHIALLCCRTPLLPPGSPGQVKPFCPADPGKISYLALDEADSAWSDHFVNRRARCRERNREGVSAPADIRQVVKALEGCEKVVSHQCDQGGKCLDQPPPGVFLAAQIAVQVSLHHCSQLTAGTGRRRGVFLSSCGW